MLHSSNDRVAFQMMAIALASFAEGLISFKRFSEVFDDFISEFENSRDVLFPTLNRVG